MARYTGPKDKLSRREGYDLFGKGANFTRLQIPPGMHGPKGTKNLSQYGKQLREKQKLKRLYGVLEKQFRGYVEEALRTRGNTGEKLISILERRLDNVIFRLGFAPSRPAARQMVSHKHIFVNGKKLNIPSYLVQPGETVSLTSKSAEIPYVKKLLDEKDFVIPTWLSRKAIVGKVEREPRMDDSSEVISMQDIVEYYSRQI